VVVLGGGVDTSIFHPRDSAHVTIRKYGLSDTERNIVFAGRYSPEKGLGTLFDAFSDREFAAGKRLTVVGADSLPDDVYRKIEELPSDVGFVNFLPQPDLADVMAAADVVVVPSSYESFGLICIEALSCGTPVVASDVGILAKLVRPPQGGVIFEREDDAERTAASLRNAIDQVLLGQNDISNYSAQVREEHNWDKISRKLTTAVGNALVNDT